MIVASSTHSLRHDDGEDFRSAVQYLYHPDTRDRLDVCGIDPDAALDRFDAIITARFHGWPADPRQRVAAWAIACSHVQDLRERCAVLMAKRTRSVRLPAVARG